MKKLLVDKYRPSKLSDYVFQNKNNERKIKKWLAEGSIPNILMEGTPGTGKTTMSRILVNELGIDDMDVLYLNGSLMKIDEIREKILPFVGKSGFSKFKVIQIEECDRLSFAQQKSLLQITEDNSERVRWIFTCNYVSKVDPALLSRLEAGHLTMSELNPDGVLEYIVNIIEQEQITFNDDNDLLSHIDAYGSDIRKIVMSIEGHTDENNILHPLESKSKSDDVVEFETIFKEGKAKERFGDLLNLTEYVDANNFEWFYSVMYENVVNNFEEVGESVIIIAESLDMATKSANQRLTLDACLYKLFMDKE